MDSIIPVWRITHSGSAKGAIRATYPAISLTMPPVPGVDAIMLGPFDLAHALGLPGQTTHKVVIEACREISAKARNNGIEIVWTMFSGSRAREEQELIATMDARIVIAGTDRRIVMTAPRDRH